jgi:pimeloyl-ACP methyl ester carboxylesterase
MGLGASLLRWPEPFIAALVDRRLHVIAFDNRDIGRSTWLTTLGRPDLGALRAAMLAGEDAAPPYSLDDMAADALHVAREAGFERFHLVGLSMGGMIAQNLAASCPDAVLSLTSIMSTTGNPELPRPHPKAAAILYGPAPSSEDRAALVAHMAAGLHYLAGPLAAPIETWRAQVEAELAHGYSAAGVTRQLAAVMCAGDRRGRLREICVPTLVLHGDADPLLPVEAGIDTAATIKGATLKRYAAMGHDIPPVLAESIAADMAGFIHARNSPAPLPPGWDGRR